MGIIRLKDFFPQPPPIGHIKINLFLMPSMKRFGADKHLLSLIVIDDPLMHLLFIWLISPLERNILI